MFAQLLGRYHKILCYQSFRAFWLGFTFSTLGDAMTEIALIWFVYSSTHSARAVGFFLLAYTGPVLAGGLVVGHLLDRFDRRRVMMIDSLVRGAAVGSIPLLYAVGHLALWHVYLVAALYGFLKMVSLAGGPALVPSLVPPRYLTTANALETLGFTVSGVVGPPLAGVLIAQIGAPYVLIVDAISYASFAFAMTRIRITPEPPVLELGTASYRLLDAVRLVLRHRILLLITIMFMTFNLGEGAMFVWLPILSTQFLSGGPQLYGLLVGALALGATASSLLVGGTESRRALGTLICIAQGLSGLALVIVFVGRHSAGWTVCGLALLGAFSAPLTIWAQTLRMQIIPPELRGRTFALLRTMMQGSVPLAGAAAGLLLPILGVPGMIAVSALLIGAPGFAGYGSRELRLAGSAEDIVPTPGAVGEPVSTGIEASPLSQ